MLQLSSVHQAIMESMKQIRFVLLTLCLVELSEQQGINMRSQRSFNSTTGPIIRVICTATFPLWSSDHTITWKFKGLQLAVNGMVETDLSDRYKVQFGQTIQNKYTSNFSISNAIKNDEGNYSCIVGYNRGVPFQVERNLLIKILQYLPPPDYPHCNTSSITLFDGDNVTFICLSGDSNPPVNLTLVLRHPSQPERFLGTEPETTVPVTIHDNNTKFECMVSSNTFKTYMSKCELGPLTVFQSSVTKEPTSNSGGSQIHTFPLIIIGSIAAGILVILIIIVIIYFAVIRKHKSVNQPNHAMDYVNSSETRANPPGTPHSSTNGVPAPNQDMPMPVYSVVKTETNDLTPHSTSAERPNLHYASTENDNSDFPIYSQVNKDHGMVDNRIYVSSGPM